MAATSPSPQSAPGFRPVPLAGLAQPEPLRFPLYLRTAEASWVLYRPATATIDLRHIGRLQAEGIGQLFIRESDRELYFSRVRAELEEVLGDRNVPIEARVDALQGIATKTAEELLAAPPSRESVAAARKVMVATSGLLLRERNALRAIRHLMSGSRELAHHSLTVGFLSMAVARSVLNADASKLMTIGLAGLLHDVGKVGHESLGNDPDHTMRGAAQLESLGLAGEVVEAARSHHERWDGSGFPYGLSGGQIPETARIVGLVNTLDKVYSGQRPRVGVFDALRILAQAYRGCFDQRFASGLVQLFQ